jgi:putative endonuclease
MWFLPERWRRNARPLGPLGEKLAVKTLRRAGYKILARNCRFGRFEIDIIAREGDTTVFVEVKTRRRDDSITPGDSVGPVKRRHLSVAARSYIANQKDPREYYRFDVASVLVPETGKPSVTIYRDAFRDASRDDC